MYEAEKIKIFQDILGNFHKSGNEYLFYCKKCDHEKRKLSVNFEKNKFKCWICDYKGNNLGRLVKRYGNFLQRQEWEKFGTSIDTNISIEEMLYPTKKTPEEQVLQLPKEFISLVNSNLPLSSLSPRKYLSSRGISKQDILKWKIGYCNSGEYKNRIIIPSFNEDGNVNYFVARAYGKEWPPYKNPNISKDIIFNQLYADFKNDLTVVEGVFDAIKADNAVPILGSSLREDSKLFQEIIKWDTTVYLALDPDAEKKAMKLIKSFLLYNIEVYKIDISGYKDVGEMSKEEFKKRKESAFLVTSESYLENAFSTF